MRKSKDTDAPGPGAGGSKYLGDTLLVTLTVAQFIELQASLQPVAANDAADELLDRVALAKALGCSPGHVDKERRAGMPCIYLGDSPRFELQECKDWLRKKGRS